MISLMNHENCRTHLISSLGTSLSVEILGVCHITTHKRQKKMFRLLVQPWNRGIVRAPLERI